MFILRTGAPGSGKTLSLIHQLKEGVKFPDVDDYRPIYYYNIPELSEQLGWIKLENPLLWYEEVPDGAIVIIDEVQEFFPTRTARDPVPEGLKVIERHRHRGLDIYFITQHPSLLDVHARRLVNEHIHLKRNFGAPFSVMYRSNEIMNDTQDYHALKKAEKTTFKYPKDTFGLYKSAEVHTHKFKLPKIFYLLVFVIGLIVSVLFYGSTLIDDKLEETSSPTSDSPFSLISDDEQILSIESFIPVINNIPASSPIYQKLWKPQSLPIVSSCIGDASNCRCYSQQATYLAVSLDYCLNVLKNGSNYDHTLKDNRQSSSKSKSNER